MTTSSQDRTTRSSADVAEDLRIVEIKKGKRFSVGLLRRLLPDVETLLFFAKLYELDARQLGTLLHTVFGGKLTVVEALTGEGYVHSHDLQGYIVDVLAGLQGVNDGDVTYGEAPPQGEVLPQMWESLEIEVAKSIKAVADKLDSVVDMLPGKQGEMVFKSMMIMNNKRPTIGDHRAAIHHAPQKENLLVLDVSGSMTEGTIRKIIEDVVAMSYKANAHMAIVSNTCTYWTPGSYTVDDVLEHAEFGGTRYEELAPLFDRDWGTVITVADYDSSWSAAQYLRDNCVGRVDLVLDVSLVNQPTFLAECLGQFADEVRPILIANGGYVLSS